MSLKSTSALEEFTNNRRSENIITGIGIDLTHNFFKQNKLLDPFKETILKNISKNNTLKKNKQIYFQSRFINLIQ
jgi:hypothetical protein